MTALNRKYVIALDSGTTSSRAIIFDSDGKPVGKAQKEHRQYFPKPGWVEHNATEIWFAAREVIALALTEADINATQVAAVGITNQRETTVVWDRRTGRPISQAIVWQDTRTQDIVRELSQLDDPSNPDLDRYRERTGLTLSTYFSGPKLRWILENVEGARERAEKGELCFGTIDSWLVWNMTNAGGGEGAVHVTDVTNASRTMLMNLRTQQWDEEILAELGIPKAMLPRIASSSEIYGYVRQRGSLPGVPIAGILGDQQAAMFGQTCFSPGDAKSTYGTGNFVLLNTGTEPVFSEHGLLTTLCYQIGNEKPVYALEGSIAVTGSLVQWLRDNLGMIDDSSEVETLANQVEDTGGVVIVPAFSGLFAPRWRPDARGVFVGLTRFTNKRHIARAALEAAAFQTREVIDAMLADSGSGLALQLNELRVDGGMTVNETLMQFQSDIIGTPVVRPAIIETTALGAAYAAGLATGVWQDTDELREKWHEDARWEPQIDDEARAERMAQWNKAVELTYDWVSLD